MTETASPGSPHFHIRAKAGFDYNGSNLIASDGSDSLTLLDPETYQSVGSIHVTLAGCSVRNLNELEWIDVRDLGQHLAHRRDCSNRSRDRQRDFLSESQRLARLGRDPLTAMLCSTASPSIQISTGSS